MPDDHPERAHQKGEHMPQADRYTLDYHDLTTAMLRHLGIHEGHWTMYVEGMFQVTNIMQNDDPDSARPCFITTLARLGVQRVEDPTPLAVDAAAVNPLELSPAWDEELRHLPRR